MAGINGFTGLIDDFARSTTVPLRFDLVDTADAAIDVTGGKVYIFFSKLEALGTASLEIVIEPDTPATGLFLGSITDTQTLALTAREYYYSIKYIASGDVTYVIDQGVATVYQNAGERIAQ